MMAMEADCDVAYKMNESVIASPAQCGVCGSAFEWRNEERAHCPTCNRSARADDGEKTTRSVYFARDCTLLVRK